LKSGKKLRGKGFQQVPPDDRLVVMTPGGAGIGAPTERDRAAVKADVESGLVSADNAAAVYGYAR
jgi:N-methylhydantoinase B